MKNIVSMSDRYVATPTERPEIADCLIDHINQWAVNGAMLGAHNHNVGFHKTAELLGTVASSFLKIRLTDSATNNVYDQELQQWLVDTSRHVINFYATQAGYKTNHNNHRYWDALQVGLAAVITENQELFNWSIDGLTIGLNEIDSEGYLPLELARGSKAFSYHAYAMNPLIMLAELAIQNPQYMTQPYNPFTYNNNGLERLAQNLINEDKGLESGLFTDSRELRCHESAWLEVFLRRASADYKNEVSELVQQKRQGCNGVLRNTYAGGNLTVMQGKPM